MDDEKVKGANILDILPKLKKLRPIDDMFFRLLSGRIQVCQELLQTLLEDEDLSVKQVIPQCKLIGINRSAVLDVLCVLSTAELVNIEVQKENSNDDLRRTRFHASLITTNYTQAGTDFSKVPDVKVIYISEYDVLKTGKPLTVKRNMVKNKNGMDCRINNGETIYFATSKVVDDTKISRLLQRMIDTDSFWDSEFPALSEAVNFFKCTKEGNLIMCKLAEELKESGRIEGRQEGQLETIVTLIKNGMISLEQAVEQFGIGEQELKVYLKK